MLYDIHTLNEPFTDQWWGEMAWWSKFVIFFPLSIDLLPLPLDILKVRHSEIKVIELHADQDPNVGAKLLEYAYKKKYDDCVIVIRNVFANDPTNGLRKLDSIEAYKEHLNMDVNYTTLYMPLNAHFKTDQMRFGDVLDRMPNTDEGIITLTGNYEFFTSQPWFTNEYKKLLTKNGIDFENSEVGKIGFMEKWIPQTFMWWGQTYRTRLHSAGAANFFLQVSNSKRWRFIHKRYTPYSNSFKALPLGNMKTPEYFVEDFADGLPYTEIFTKPGDLMFFPYWHMHEVTNLEANKVGLGIGIRKGDPLKRLFKEPVGALKVYNFLCMPGMLLHGLLYGSAFDSTADDKCKSFGGRSQSWTWNGTHTTRYDLKKVDGECKFAERRPDFQMAELSGVIDKDEWAPRAM